MSPRVLLVGTVLGQGASGVARHAREVFPRAARLLAERGGALVVLEPRGGLAAPFEGAERIVDDRLVPHPAWRRALSEPGAVARAVDAHGPFDVVHAGHLPAPSARARRGVPLCWMVHDLRRAAFDLRGVLGGRASVRRAARDAAAIVTVSGTVAAELARLHPGVAARTHVASHGHEHLAPLAPDAATPAPSLDRGYLLHVGHVEPRKNLALLVDALALDPGLPPLVLAGSGRPRAVADLLARARRRGVAERVRHVGAFDEATLPALYARAAAVVVPSQLEGFGLSALEAQLARRPLAVSTAGALPETTGGLCPTFPPDDPARCAAALREALALPTGALERAHASAAARTWDSAAVALLTAWEAAFLARPGAKE